MPLTKAMRVREVFADDWPAVEAIARANGFEDFEWPYGAWGALAVLDDHTVAFCAGRDVPKGILIEELWCVPTADGLRGLASLAEWVENAAKSLARQIGRKIMVGGFVPLDNERHASALAHRGYKLHMHLYAKEISGES